jgi:hypothetical protein
MNMIYNNYAAHKHSALRTGLEKRWKSEAHSTNAIDRTGMRSKISVKVALRV